MPDNEKPKFENEIPAETISETPEIASEQWTDEDQEGLEELQRNSLAHDRADLETLRTEMGLPVNGPDDETPEFTNLEDILKKGQAKGLVIETSEIDTNSKKTEYAKKLIAQQEKRRNEETIKQQDNTAEQMTPQQKLEKALESGDARQIDHASYPIFKAARQAENWALAIEMIQHAKPGEARNGRIGVVKKEMEEAGQAYTGPIESTPDQQPSTDSELLGITELDIDKANEQQITKDGLPASFNLENADEAVRKIFVNQYIRKAKKELGDFIEENLGKALNKNKALILLNEKLVTFLQTQSQDFISEAKNIEKIGYTFRFQTATFEEEDGDTMYITSATIGDYEGTKEDMIDGKISEADKTNPEEVIKTTAEQLSHQQKLEKALESGDARQIDHASYPIFKAARQAENWALAIEMIQHAKPGEARNGRIGVVKKEMEEAGQAYTGPEKE